MKPGTPAGASGSGPAGRAKWKRGTGDDGPARSASASAPAMGPGASAATVGPGARSTAGPGASAGAVGQGASGLSGSPDPSGRPGQAGRPDHGDGDEGRRGCLGGLVGFVADKGIPLLIAVLGLLAALATTYGAVVKADANQLEDDNGALDRRIENLEQENSDLRTEVETLTEERNRLREQVSDMSETEPPTEPEGGDPSTSPITTPETPRRSTVLRETGDTPLTFASGYSVDLDTDAPDWGVRSGTSGDIYFYLGSSSTSEPQLLSDGEVSVVDHVPTEAECDDATVLQPQVPQDQIRQGLQICTLTSEDRFAYVRIATIDPDARTITLDIIVWE